MPAIVNLSSRSFTASVVAGAAIFAGSAAIANPIVNFNISVLGGTGGPYNSGPFNQGSNPTADPGVFNVFSGTGLSDPSGFNEWSISTWDFQVDDDPNGGGPATGARLGAGFIVTNNRADDVNPALNHLYFSILISVPIAPVSNAAFFYGDGGMTLSGGSDTTPNWAKLSAIGSPIWNYQLNGVDVASLFAPPFFLGFTGSSTASTSANLTAAQTTPLIGAAVTSLGIRLDFDLTPGETASFNGKFGFIPVVPAPGAMALLGLAGLVARGRRRS